jgi:hypothetical protein
LNAIEYLYRKAAICQRQASITVKYWHDRVLPLAMGLVGKFVVVLDGKQVMMLVEKWAVVLVHTNALVLVKR